MPELVVLTHTAGAGPSAFIEVLDARTGIATWRVVDVTAGDDLPEDPQELAGLVVMGGRMSAVDPARHAWMPAELDLIRRAVDADVPVLGVCLGAQLLAQAFGGEVARREVPEVGFLPLVRTDEGRTDPVVAGWPDHAMALFVHEDEVVRSPDDARPVLDGGGGSAAWRLGSALAVQFHPEVTAEQLATWVEDGLLDDLLARTATDGDTLVDEARRRDRFTVALGRALFGRFLDGPVRERVT